MDTNNCVHHQSRRVTLQPKTKPATIPHAQLCYVQKQLYIHTFMKVETVQKFATPRVQLSHSCSQQQLYLLHCCVQQIWWMWGCMEAKKCGPKSSCSWSSNLLTSTFTSTWSAAHTIDNNHLYFAAFSRQMHVRAKANNLPPQQSIIATLQSTATQPPPTTKVMITFTSLCSAGRLCQGGCQQLATPTVRHSHAAINSNTTTGNNKNNDNPYFAVFSR